MPRKTYSAIENRAIEAKRMDGDESMRFLSNVWRRGNRISDAVQDCIHELGVEYREQLDPPLVY